jgi:hypothetical protein
MNYKTSSFNCFQHLFKKTNRIHPILPEISTPSPAIDTQRDTLKQILTQWQTEQERDYTSDLQLIKEIVQQHPLSKLEKETLFKALLLLKHLPQEVYIQIIDIAIGFDFKMACGFLRDQNLFRVALYKKNYPIAKALLSAAKPQILAEEKNRESSALTIAVFANRSTDPEVRANIATFLIENGFKTTPQNVAGCTIFHLIVLRHDTLVLDELLKAPDSQEALKKKRIHKNQTALMLANELAKTDPSYQDIVDKLTLATQSQKYRA